jgi:hypothetical protein
MGSDIGFVDPTDHPKSGLRPLLTQPTDKQPQWPSALAEESKPPCDQRRQITVPPNELGAPGKRVVEAWTLARGAGARAAATVARKVAL